MCLVYLPNEIRVHSWVLIFSLYTRSLGVSLSLMVLASVCRRGIGSAVFLSLTSATYTKCPSLLSQRFPHSFIYLFIIKCILIEWLLQAQHCLSGQLTKTKVWLHFAESATPASSICTHFSLLTEAFSWVEFILSSGPLVLLKTSNLLLNQPWPSPQPMSRPAVQLYLHWLFYRAHRLTSNNECNLFPHNLLLLQQSWCYSKPLSNPETWGSLQICPFHPPFHILSFLDVSGIDLFSRLLLPTIWFRAPVPQYFLPIVL